jgi:beta-glucosidase
MSISQNEHTRHQIDPQLTRAFPADFLWGAATASYQIEGAAWEDGRGSCIWDDFARTPGKVFQGDNGDVAVDHYHRVDQDTDLMRSLGLKAYRFSIAWPRILPQGRGLVNTIGLDFYDRLVDTLLEKGISPYATLYHWDLPSALETEGGWLNRDTALAFADYADIVSQRLGDRVQGWITLNEPWCSAWLGYGVGVHAPGKTDRQGMVNAAHHLLLAHGLAIPRIRANITNAAEVGITLNVSHVTPADDRPETIRDAAMHDAFSNGWYFDPLFKGHYPPTLFEDFGVAEPPIQEGDLATISAPLDFLGINYYSRSVIKGSATKPLADQTAQLAPVPGACYTAMGWEIYPQGIRDHLLHIHKEYGLPRLYITENGSAFDDHWNGNNHVNDPRRVDYLRSHVQAISEAIAQGVPLHGYFAWSLMDNYEWAEGYNKRFGIVYVDYPTQTRVIKDSGHWYAALLKAHREEYQG